MITGYMPVRLSLSLDVNLHPSLKPSGQAGGAGQGLQEAWDQPWAKLRGSLSLCVWPEAAQQHLCPVRGHLSVCLSVCHGLDSSTAPDLLTL